MNSIRYTVARADLRDIRADSEPNPVLADGEVRLRVDRVALTANNITYAAFGEAMHYWAFYPCSDPQRGCIPVWGHAEVIESRCEGIAVGERCYGFWPMAQQVVLQPVRVGPQGFVDGAAHRRALPAIYNQVLRCRSDPMYQAATEDLSALLRPLFTTAFLIDDFLAEASHFGASAVWLSSASSKTALATAFCMVRRRHGTGTPRVCGLSSPAHLPHLQGLGLYDALQPYEDAAGLDDGAAVVYVDFSGNATLRHHVHERLGERLRHSSAVGGTHWAELSGSPRSLPGPRPTLFFAPEQARRRIGVVGEAAFGQALASAWQAYLSVVAQPEAPWLRVAEAAGPEAVCSRYRALVDGAVPADLGLILLP